MGASIAECQGHSSKIFLSEGRHLMYPALSGSMLFDSCVRLQTEDWVWPECRSDDLRPNPMSPPGQL